MKAHSTSSLLKHRREADRHWLASASEQVFFLGQMKKKLPAPGDAGYWYDHLLS